MSNSSDDLPYRSFTPLTIMPKADSTATDEQQFSTLLEARENLAKDIEALYKDFNAFDLSKAENEHEAVAALLYQIRGKQTAYDILVPVLDAMDSTIMLINDKWKR